VLPRAGGSSLAGQAVNAALVIDTTRHLDQILEINAEEGWVRVQPGLVLDTLNAALRPHGLHFGPDPASSNRACLGGIVSNNASGSHSILYGMTVDHVLEMKVILDDGSPAHFRPWTASNCAGTRSRAIGRQPSTAQVSNLVYDERNRGAIRPAPRATGGAAAATTWRALSTTAASTTTCPRMSASTWSTCWPAPKARWPPSPNSSSRSHRDRSALPW
jgi:hypothetical protein